MLPDKHRRGSSQYEGSVQLGRISKGLSGLTSVGTKKYPGDAGVDRSRFKAIFVAHLATLCSVDDRSQDAILHVALEIGVHGQADNALRHIVADCETFGVAGEVLVGVLTV